MYIPYRQLSLQPMPLTLCVGIKATIRLTQQGGRECELSLPSSYTFDGRGDHPDNLAYIDAGSSFIVEYNGVSQEISIGRRFLVNDL